MEVSVAALSARLEPGRGWPGWVETVPYDLAAHPQAAALLEIERGANCQRFAYAVLDLFGRSVPPHRSSELWDDPSLVHVAQLANQDLDLVLFSDTGMAWGAHVAVVFGSGLLHLCAEVGRPAIWEWDAFASRRRYSQVVGIVRVPCAGTATHARC